MYYNTNKMGCGSDSSRMMTTLKDVFFKKMGGGGKPISDPIYSTSNWGQALMPSQRFELLCGASHSVTFTTPTVSPY
jgi:hypothetical protein